MKITKRTPEEAQDFVDALFKEKKYVMNVHELPEGQGYEIQYIEHKMYTAHDGKEFPDEVWMTEAGDMKLIQELEPEHARNVLRMLLRQEREARQRMEALTEHLAGAIAQAIENGEIGDPELESAPAVSEHHVLH